MDKAWGIRNNVTGEWGGMIRSLVLNEVDVTWTGMFPSLDRHNAGVQFLPGYVDSYHAMVRNVAHCYRL